MPGAVEQFGEFFHVRPPAHDAHVSADQAWVASVTGGQVTRFERALSGGSRLTFLVDVCHPDGQTRELLLQRTGFGPYFGTEIAVPEHEYAVLRALRGTDIAVGELVAVTPDGCSKLIERKRGSHAFNAIADPEQARLVQRGYLHQIAALHALHPSDFSDLAIMSVAPDTRGRALQFTRRWEQLFDEHVQRPCPIVRLAIGWLMTHAPEAADRPVLCHGDPGPGNFLFDGDAVTALTDWELAHVGDRHADLGGLVLRGYQLGRMTDLRSDIEEYERLTGARVDLAAVAYYRIAVLLLGLVTSLVQRDSEREGRLSMPWYLFLVPMLTDLLTQALGQAMGVELVEPEPVPEDVDPVELEVLDVLGDKIPPLLPDVGSPGVPGLLGHLRLYAARGAGVQAAELADLTSFLGRRPDSVETGRREVQSQIESGGVDPEETLHWCYRSARRQSSLWPAVIDMDLVPISLDG